MASAAVVNVTDQSAAAALPARSVTLRVIVNVICRLPGRSAIGVTVIERPATARVTGYAEPNESVRWTVFCVTLDGAMSSLSNICSGAVRLRLGSP